MVPGNEFSTFGLRHPSQTQTVIICLKIPRPKLPITRHTTLKTNGRRKKKKKQLLAIFTACLRGRAPCLSACVCDRNTEQEREIEMKQSSPYVKSDWNILAISHHLYYLRGLGKAI